MTSIRDLSGLDLIKRLKPLGYIIIRQTGSHIRLSTEINGAHRITVPNHKTLRIGTILNIINETSMALRTTKVQVYMPHASSMGLCSIIALTVEYN